MTSDFSDLKTPKRVPFEKVFIDPNNPRIAPDRAARYENPDDIFDPDLQNTLTAKTYEVYNAGELEDAIVEQGWIPIDPIIVWEHPDRKGHYIVVEGNTRTSVLRRLRQARIVRERAKLKKFQKASKIPAAELRHQERLVAQLETIIATTDNLLVYPVNADTIDELEKVLPRLLGVRHIKHAQQWGPYATNLYITSLYERLFRERHGAEEDIRIEKDLVQSTGAMVSLKETKTRRNIQSASAFDHFKRHYEDRLPEGEEFSDEDHYFFELILQNTYPRDQFGFTADRLHLPEESEEALFSWAFSKPRPTNKEEQNPNIFHKAENIRLWQTMSKYDTENGTGFATLFDVSAPEKATKPMSVVEAEYLLSKSRQKPLDTLQSLLKALKEIKGETMIFQAEYLQPTLKEIAELTEHYLKMIDADAA